MTTQPTVVALENQHVAYPAIDLATTGGVQHWLGGFWPSACVLAQQGWVASHKDLVQKVVDALVATVHWISSHSAAQIASKMPPSYVSNGLTTKADYISALAKDKAQFLPNGIMPASGPRAVLATEKTAGKVTGPVTLATTYTNSFAIKANKLEGFMK